MPAAVSLELPVGDPKAQTVQTKNSSRTTNLINRLSKFSSRLLRPAKGNKSSALSTVSEEKLIIKDLQNQGLYQEEVKLLSKEHQLPRHNKLYHLDVFLDAEGMLKVEGRLSRSCFAAPFKHHTVILQGQHITKLIIAHCERIKHQGKGFTINEITFTLLHVEKVQLKANERVTFQWNE